MTQKETGIVLLLQLFFSLPSAAIIFCDYTQKIKQFLSLFVIFDIFNPANSGF